MSDEEIILLYKNGEEEAFKELINRYTSPLYNFVARLGSKNDASDIVQETFIKVWKNMNRFDENKASFKTWIFTIAKNTAYDYFKKKKTVPFYNFTDEQGNNKLENIADENIFPDELLMRADAANILEKKLQELPEHYRLILNLHYQEDFSLSEIAAILKIPYNTAKSQHQRGLVKLRELLK